MRLDINVYGEEQVSRELMRFGERSLDPRPAFLRVHELMTEQIAEQFDSEGARGSGGWAPLAESTVLAKAAAGVDPNILLFSHALRDSLVDPGAGAHIMRMGESSLTFGSSIPYGIFHQKGTSRMPMRKPVEFTELDRRNFMKTLQNYIVQGRATPV